VKKSISTFYLFSGLLLFSLVSLANQVSSVGLSRHVTDKPSLAGSSVIWVPDNYKTIQAAVYAAKPGDTIYVRSGRYLENVKVNVSVRLIGVGFPEVCGYKKAWPFFFGYPTFSVERENVTISGFVVTHLSPSVEGDPGITMSTGCTATNNIVRGNERGIETGYRNTIRNNTIINNYEGVSCSGSYNTIENNTVTANYGSGVSCSGSYNVISGNNISNNSGGIFLPMKSNTIVGNTISSNSYGAILWYDKNIIFHNNFINNTSQVMIDAHEVNAWDDCYPSGGNYWSHLNLTDAYSGPFQNETGSDGIVDAPYVIDVDNQDHYPLAGPFNSFDIDKWNETVCHIDVISNSSVSSLQLNQTQKTISFNVTGLDGTAGFCRVTIPNVVVQEMWQGNYTILVNGQPTQFRNWTDPQNTYIYFTYQHSEHQVVIIPELLPITALPLIIMLSSIVAVLKKRRLLNIALNHKLMVKGGGEMRNVACLVLIGVLLVCSALLPRFVLGYSADSIAEVSSCGSVGNHVLGDSSVIWVPDNYTTIQAAVYAAKPGSTIYVRNKTYYEYVVPYYENVIVNKTVRLVGLGFPVVDGSYGSLGSFWGLPTFRVEADNVTINGFIIQHGLSGNIEMDWGIELSSGCNVSNNIIQLNCEGIHVLGGRNTIESNLIINNYGGGVGCSGSLNIIRRNNITNNEGGGVFFPRPSNFLIENTISNNYEGIAIWDPNNVVYHNNFINNTNQVSVDEGLINTWDDGYPSGGNYWSHLNVTDSYSGTFQNETGSDGIGDSPYKINAWNQDNYPLMGPINSFYAGTWNTTSYSIDIISNSTISNFQFNEAEETITFNVSTLNSTSSFCRVTIPKQLLWCNTTDEWQVIADTASLSYAIIETIDNTYTYSTYSNSTTTIQIKATHAIPELRPTVLPILLALATTALLLEKLNKKLRQKQKLHHISLYHDKSV
jgi:parallel beta-helix repeat protein